MFYVFKAHYVQIISLWAMLSTFERVAISRFACTKNSYEYRGEEAFMLTASVGGYGNDMRPSKCRLIIVENQTQKVRLLIGCLNMCRSENLNSFDPFLNRKKAELEMC